MNAEKIINGMRSQVQTISHQIEDLNRQRYDNTPKRQREAMGRRFDASNLERIRRTMECLADRWQCGDLPAEFESLRTRSVIGPLVSKRSESNGYYHVCESNEFRDDCDLAKRLREFVAAHTGDKFAEQDAARAEASRIAALEEKVKFAKIPGFFPTPECIIARMIFAAEIEPGMDVLEPSAGKGDISAAATQRGAKVTSVERNYTLCDIIEAKGLQVTRGDFMELAPTPMYDRVLMNPPFEKGLDMTHVTRAMEWLRPGGRLVAIMAPGFQRKDSRFARDFRDMVEANSGVVEDLPAGSFESAFNPTSVSTCMLVMDKPAAEGQEQDPVEELTEMLSGPKDFPAVPVQDPSAFRVTKRKGRCTRCKVDMPIGSLACWGAGPVRCSICGPVCSSKAPTQEPAVEEAPIPVVVDTETPAVVIEVPKPTGDLATQLRPQKLDDIAGQDHVVEMLRNFVKNPFPTAFVFSGETGTGKTSAAIALANELGCQTEHAEFGGLFQIPAGDQNADEVRTIWERMHLGVWLGSGWKVLLVNEADRMGRPAENIWLDRLESPPPKTVVIFTTNEVDRLAQRFRDRCNVAHFESDALLVAPAAKSWISRLMTTVTNVCPAPAAVEAFFDECVRDGHFSYRRAVFALQSSLLIGKVRAA